MQVFVSSQAVDRRPASDLIRGLRMAGVDVTHSPRNPLDGADPRWEDWYQSELPAAIEGCDVFIIVVDQGWDSSTWMGIEADAGLAVPSQDLCRHVFFWNPGAIAIKAAGMAPYLKHELPRGLAEAIDSITAGLDNHGMKCDGKKPPRLMPNVRRGSNRIGTTMSYDLVIFDPVEAPLERSDFLKWYEQQTEEFLEVSEVTSHELQTFFFELNRKYPAMNGPHASDDIDNPKLTDYAFGRSSIYMCFAWSQASEARRDVAELAKMNSVGFYEISDTEGSIWRPDQPENLASPNDSSPKKPWWQLWK